MTTSELTSAPAIEALRILPPAETVDRPPPFATHVRVVGGLDAATLEFFYVAPERLAQALAGTSGQGVEVEGPVATVRSEPVARVVVPLTVSLELVAQLVEAGAGGATDLVSLAGELARRATVAVQEANASIGALNLGGVVKTAGHNG